MYLFILESIGTSELILIGIVALLFLGPRRLPEVARKIGKLTAEFRGTANEFKETWQREVDFEEEAKALRLDDLDDLPVPRSELERASEPVSAPTVRSVDPADFEFPIADSPVGEESDQSVDSEDPATETQVGETVDSNDKRSWL